MNKVLKSQYSSGDSFVDPKLGTKNTYTSIWECSIQGNTKLMKY